MYSTGKKTVGPFQHHADTRMMTWSCLSEEHAECWSGREVGGGGETGGNKDKMKLNFGRKSKEWGYI